MRDLITIIENHLSSPAVIDVLYHGTDAASAANLVENGWQPNTWGRGANMGQTRYLYLTNVRENARWFANEKGADTVVEVRDIPVSYLGVDPEDGVADSVEQELNSPHGLPGNVVLWRSLPASEFRIA